ncbi:anti-sigma factor [Actinacidiphila acidipaludis]|uniref:Regulator of SigK n=1 Tax=Actinacidiphila acidipaludis TaxID=2873382 RepID=A0ABS7QAB8_9ACTN|nr:anti-sigma factor [Streptomyces acidipaludis]MBY8880115.1 anti-sigma factor [Streptomyces acidipaludis]
MTTVDLHTLTGAYAVGALSGPEAEAFRRHMAECEACAQEVRELSETAARLALAVAEVPPDGLRERVMASLPEVRQLPPEVAVVPLHPAARRGPARRLPHLAAAACLVIAGIATGVAVDAQHRADVQHRRSVRAEQQAAELSALTSAPDATLHTGALKGGGTATVVASRSLGRAAVLFHDLPALSGSRVYELWYSHGGTMVPAGLVEPGRTAGAAVLAGAPTGADGVGITAEPHGGSPAPTGAPLVVLPV